MSLWAKCPNTPNLYTTNSFQENMTQSNMSIKAKTLLRSI